MLSRIKRIKAVVFALLLPALPAGAFNYVVGFAGKGASTEVSSVLVQNITKGTSVTVPSGHVLHLTDGLTTVEGMVQENEGGLTVFSDRSGRADLEFQVPAPGMTSIGLFSPDGRKLASLSAALEAGRFRFNLTLPEGVCIVRVQGNGFTYATKLVSRGAAGNAARIVSEGGVKDSAPARVQSVSAVSMDYSPGDRIIFRATSGTMITLVSEVITADKTIEFNFVPCTDANGNHYATITIGDQVWMAENLKATKYADGTDITLRASQAEFLADPDRRTTPICRYFNDDPATKDIAGLAYKYQTIHHKDLCPEGWHIPDHFEWRTLRDAISLQTLERYNSIRRTGPYWSNSGATNASGFSAVGAGTFWEEWPIHYGTWAIWLASDLWNNDPNNCWFFHAATSDNPPYGDVVCDEIASDAFAMFGAIRCVKNKDNSYDVLKLGELPIGIWVTPPAAFQTNDEYRRIKELGINFVNGFHYSENVSTRLLQVLNFCSNNGLKFLANKAVVANDILSYASSQDPGLLTKFIEGIRLYANHPAFAGELLLDEPGKNLFSSIAAFTTAFQQHYPGKLAHVNLFPTYATGGIQAPDYINYIDSWIQSQRPGHISFDSYPLLTNGGIIRDYFYNLDLVRSKADQNQIPYWTFIQTLSIAGTPGVPDKREPSEVDIRWQVWSNLAFGAKGIQYFTYWSPEGGAEQFGQGLIDTNGQETVRYQYVKKINTDIRTIGKILLQCDAVGVIQTSRTPFAMYSPLSGFGDIAFVSGDDSLMGCFRSPEGKQKVLVTSLYPAKQAELILNFSKIKPQVKMWKNNTAQTVRVDDTRLILSVLPGEAVLLEL